ncbi:MULTISPECIES: hypothetical protein [unclassified Streptomyces]|uniref:hypothetical protein n=1 Tax=unclassified Streptomyces TaxID=2593676 RepID=UPI00344EA244
MTPATVSPSPWTRRFHPCPEAPARLFVLPRAGGAAGFSRPWPKAPADAQEWRRHTTGPFATRSFPGGRFFLSAHLPEITRLILGAAPAGDPAAGPPS